MLDGVSSCLREDAESYVEATRVIENSIAAAVSVPGNMRRVNINDLHVSLVYSRTDALRDAARQVEILVIGELVSRAGCSEEKGRRIAVP